MERNCLALCSLNVFGKGLRGPLRLAVFLLQSAVCLPGLDLP